MKDQKILRPVELPHVRKISFSLLGVGLIHGLFALVSFHGLPDKVPSHFGLSGRPDAYSDGGSVSWFMLFFVSAALSLLAYGFVSRLDQIPLRFINMPRREEFAALPEYRRAKVLGVVAFHIILLMLVVMITFFSLHLFTALVAHGVMDGLPIWFLLIIVATTALDAGFMIWAIHRAVTREIEDYAEDLGKW